MSNSELDSENEPVVQYFLQDLKSESSIEVPPEEWESLISLPSLKNSLQYTCGLRDPGIGEICGKYIALSSSTVDRHPYFKYPSVKDPGIYEALLDPEPQTVYPDDGQELYLALCLEMNMCPIRCFHRQLVKKSIDLSYYGVAPRNVPVIATALSNNRLVKSVNFTDNFLTNDGCFHLGEMLAVNTRLTELNLSGCRIGPKGALRLFANLHNNRALKKLNLSRNELGDEGVQYFADVVFKGCPVLDVDFSHNSLVGPSLIALVNVFETHNKLTHINLSWNKITLPNAIYALCAKLSENEAFREMRLAWNNLRGQRVANAIKVLMKCKSIQLIDLSNNALCSTLIVKALGFNLAKAKTLETLDLSYNPLSQEDAMIMLKSMQDDKVKLKNLLMDNVAVDYHFTRLQEEIFDQPFRKDTVITHGYVKEEFKPTLVDMKRLMLCRAQAVCNSVRRKVKPDFAVIILGLQREFGSSMGMKDFRRSFQQQGVTLADELIEQMSRAFPGPKGEKTVLISLDALADYAKRLWPDVKLPQLNPVKVVEKLRQKKKK